MPFTIFALKVTKKVLIVALEFIKGLLEYSEDYILASRKIKGKKGLTFKSKKYSGTKVRKEPFFYTYP